jgi:hypothetical protein
VISVGFPDLKIAMGFEFYFKYTKTNNDGRAIRASADPCINF